jgi:metal-responsive CopG/Arc/MetJ family transcriptional regulator
VFDTRASQLHNVVEIFNNLGSTMPTVNFSVPEDIKNAFNSTFEGQNKSAVIAELMREAVERAQSQQRSKEAYQRILARRQSAPRVTEQQFRAAREEGRT